MRRAALALAAVLAAISGPVSAQDVHGGDTLDICNDFNSIVACLDHVADQWREWSPPDYQEYGTAAALADWRTDWPECDTLQNWVQQAFPASGKFLFAPPSDSMPGFRFFFANFKSEYDGMEGFASKNKLGPPIRYIVIRNNWDFERIFGADRKRKILDVIIHEVSHAGLKTSEAEAKEMEDCAERNLTKEEAIPEGERLTAKTHLSTIDNLKCVAVRQRTCATFRIDPRGT